MLSVTARSERLCEETAREADIFRLASNPVIELDPAGKVALGVSRVVVGAPENPMPGE